MQNWTSIMKLKFWLIILFSNNANNILDTAYIEPKCTATPCSDDRQIGSLQNFLKQGEQRWHDQFLLYT